MPLPYSGEKGDGSAGAGGSSAGGLDSVAGVQATPSVINLAGLEAEARMLDELRHRTRAHSGGSSGGLMYGGGGAGGRAGGQHQHSRGYHGDGAESQVGLDDGTDSEAGVGAAGGSTTTAAGAPVPPVPPLFAVAAPLARMGLMNVVDDSFTRCFKSMKRVPWNWNLYLWPAWGAGLLFRYVLLFPLRLLALALGFLTIALAMPLAKLASYVVDTRKLEVSIIQLFASSFVASWSGVVRIHGLRPTPRPGKPAGVFVANHSSMIDFIILLQSHPYAVVGQHHPGWVGFLQDHVLGALNCVWFNRGEAKDRKVVAERLKAHAHDPSKADNPLLVFPEGTCVNNEYVVQFKKGVFELGVPINPVAIKYNKVFVDGYWNSREQSFAQHLFRLMTSWAVVCDVWFLDQQTARPGESPSDFAKRVQRLIAARAGLKAVDWDGYMKYWKPNQRFLERQQRLVAEQLCGEHDIPFASVATPTLPNGSLAPPPAPAPPAAGGGGAVPGSGKKGDAPAGEANSANSAAAGVTSPKPPLHPSPAAGRDSGASSRAGSVFGGAGARRAARDGSPTPATPPDRPGSVGTSVSSSTTSGGGGGAQHAGNRPRGGPGSTAATPTSRSTAGGGVGGALPPSGGGGHRPRTGTHGTVTSLLSAASTTPRIRNAQPLVGDGISSFPDGDAIAYHRDRRESADPDGEREGELYVGGNGGGGASGGDAAAVGAGSVAAGGEDARDAEARAFLESANSSSKPADKALGLSVDEPDAVPARASPGPPLPESSDDGDGPASGVSSAGSPSGGARQRRRPNRA